MAKTQHRKRNIEGREYWADSEWTNKHHANQRASSVKFQYRCRVRVRKWPEKKLWIVWATRYNTDTKK